jgi:hypothetical protein
MSATREVKPEAAIGQVPELLLVEERPGVAAQHAADLVEGRRDGGTESRGAHRAQEVAADQERRRLRRRQLDRQAERELLLELPEETAPISGLVVVKRTSGLLEHAKVAPDRADSATQVPRGIINGDAGRALEELPLPSEFVPARHVKNYGMRIIFLTGLMCAY